MTFVIIDGQTLIVMQSTLITSIISIVFRTPVRFFYFRNSPTGKIRKFLSGVEINKRRRAEFSELGYFIVFYCSGRFARRRRGLFLVCLRMSHCCSADFFRAYVTGDGSVEDMLVTEMKYGCALQNYGNDNEARQSASALDPLFRPPDDPDRV